MSVENEKEIQQLKNRIRELADKSYNQNQDWRSRMPCGRWNGK